MTAPAVETRSGSTARTRFASQLAGKGIELGPGHHPYELGEFVDECRYVDRWMPDENRALFPELGDAAFPQPDLVANFDVDGLNVVGDASVDFVIASHVLEHVANPLAMLDEIDRVLRPGGLLLLLLPDRRQTFDRDRAATPLEHLVEEHSSGTVAVSDAHIVEFVSATEDRDPASVAGDEIERHRLRSIHVHCWTELEFIHVLEHAVSALDHRWELVDATTVGEAGETGIEFGFLLRKGIVALDGPRRAERLGLAWESWLAGHRAGTVEEVRHELGQCRSHLTERQAELAALQGSPSWQLFARCVRVVRRVVPPPVLAAARARLAPGGHP